MKKKFLGLPLLATALSLSSVLSLTACSDDNSTPSSETNVENPGDGLNPDGTFPPDFNGGIPGDNGQINPSPVPGDSTGSGVTDSDENIADKPISDEELKDDGTSSVVSLEVNFSGVGELGPFAEGAAVAVKSVDVKTMAVSGSAIDAKVSGNLGAYSAAGSLNSAVASIEVSGNYLNYTMDEPASTTVGIKALSDLRERKTVNVNVLTRLEYDRVVHLVSNMGLSFTAAKARAEKEVLAALGFNQDSTAFEDISLYDRNEAGTYLLAITTILLTDRTAADVDAALAAIAADIAIDGTWDDLALKANLADISYSMDMAYPLSVLSDKNNNATLQYINTWVDRFWAAQYDLGKCGPNNQNQLKPNGNSLSVKASSQFVCQDSMWSEASSILLEHLAATALFGECSANNEGVMKANAEGKYFVCKKNIWKVADGKDMDNLKVIEANGPCTSANEKQVVAFESSHFMCLSNSWVKTKNTPVDYSKGHAMNKKLGSGMNLGNSWDATSADDGGWSNPIQDGDFAALKAAGFNSVRIPVRWYTGVDTKLTGVQQDVDLAMKAGLAVIVNYHHYDPLLEAAKSYPGGNYPSEKQKFLDVWKRVATTFNKYDDDKVVFEIFNEPREIKQEAIDDIMNSAYEVIRAAAPGKTIMFEGNGYSKFAQIPKLKLPADGNIIVSGHYYEPYSFTHQDHGYACNDAAGNGIASMAGHFKSYADSIAITFPDVNGGSVPMNLGEFGVANQGSCRSIPESERARWTDAVLAEAVKYGMSWHYWAYTKVGGFEAAPGRNWSVELLQVFQKYMK